MSDLKIFIRGSLISLLFIGALFGLASGLGYLVEKYGSWVFYVVMSILFSLSMGVFFVAHVKELKEKKYE